MVVEVLLEFIQSITKKNSTRCDMIQRNHFPVANSIYHKCHISFNNTHVLDEKLMFTDRDCLMLIQPIPP